MLSLSCAEADEAVIEKAILAAQAADVDDEDAKSVLKATAHPLRVLESPAKRRLNTQSSHQRGVRFQASATAHLEVLALVLVPRPRMDICHETVIALVLLLLAAPIDSSQDRQACSDPASSYSSGSPAASCYVFHA